MKRYPLLCISFIMVLTAPYLHVTQSTIAAAEETAYRGDDPSRKQTKQTAPTDVKRGAAVAVEPARHGATREEILILNSYHPGYGWSDNEQAGIIDLLQAKDKNWVPVIEYLDLKRLPDGKHLPELKQLFRFKYQNKKFSTVIAMDNPALEFATDNQAELFGNAPIVFCGINNYTSSLLKGRSNITGIEEAIDIAGTIEVMLRLHPSTREIFSPLDYTTTGLAVRKELKGLVPRFGAKVRFRFTDPLTMEELLTELERLPKNSLVLAITFITDRSGHTFSISETTELFSKHSPVPIYSTYEQRLGFGIVGGKLLSPRIHGADAARIALRVLAGEKTSAIPVVLESDSQLMFDYKVMSRFGIPLSALPEGSTVINKPVSFYAAHRVVIQTALGIIGILAIVICLLTIIIIQRRRSAIALRASEAKYYDLYENAPDMHFSVDVKTAAITECNNTLVKAFGYSKEEILGRSLFEIYHPDCREEAKRVFQQFAATGKVPDAERKIVCKDGSIIDVSLKVSFVRDKDGKITHGRSVWHDITKRKQMEDVLRESEERFRAIADYTIDWESWIGPDGKLIWINPAVSCLTGYSIKECLAMNDYPISLFDETDRERMTRIFAEVIQGATYNNVEFRIRCKDGSIKWGELSCQPIYNASGINMGHRSSIRAITDRKQTEEALRQVEENYRRSLDDSPLGVRIVTIEGETIYANRAILDFYGYDSTEELRTTPLKERYIPESYAEFHIRREKRKRGAYVPSEYDIIIIRKDGKVRHLHVFRKEILWNGEQQFQVIYQDITERKQAEEERKAHIRFLESMERIEQAIMHEKNVEQMLWNIIKTVFSIFDCDRAWLLYPCDPDAPSFRVPIEIYRPEYPGAKVLNVDVPMSPSEARNMREALESDDPVTYTAGTERPISTAVQFGVQSQMFIPVYPKLGNPWMFGMHQCSYPRIWTEEEQILFREIGRRISDGLSGVLFLRELQESEERFRATFEQAAVGIAHVAADGRWMRINQKFCDIVGYSREELLQKTFQDITHPDDLDVDLEYFRKALAAEIQTYRREKRYFRKDGSIVWINLTVSIVHPASGEPRHLISVIEDITERKRMEDALRESEERYRSLFTRAPDGIFILSTDGNFMEVNESFAHMHGYSVQEMLHMNLKDVDKLETSHLTPERIHRTLAGEALTFETKHYHKDGHSFPLEVSTGRISYGGKTYIQSFHRDITDRKREEEELRASREQMRALAGRLEAVREEERTTIARKIHDELGGTLTGLKIDFSFLTKSAIKIENETVRKSLLDGIKSMIKSIDITIHAVRKIAMELRPGILDDLGLVAALEWQLKDFEKRTGIRCKLFLPGEDISLGADLSTALFRIFQEALANATRHSGATEIRVRLHVDEYSTTLEIEDNGKGIEKKKILSSKSLGLLGMRERAMMFGGSITVTGTPGMGTKVKVEISPVEKGKIDQDQGGDAG